MRTISPERLTAIEKSGGKAVLSQEKPKRDLHAELLEQVRRQSEVHAAAIDNQTKAIESLADALKQQKPITVQPAQVVIPGRKVDLDVTVVRDGKGNATKYSVKGSVA